MQEAEPWKNIDLDIYLESPSRTKIRRSSVPFKDGEVSNQEFLGIETTQAIFHSGEKLKTVHTLHVQKEIYLAREASKRKHFLQTA